MAPDNQPEIERKYSFEDLPDIIKHFYSHGAINVLPLKEGGKEPYLKQWKRYQGIKYDEKRIKRHRGNFALVCGQLPGWNGGGYLTILDIDDGKGPDGLYKLFHDINTLQVKTPKKGYHIYFWSMEPVLDSEILNKRFHVDLELRGTPKHLATLPPSYVKYKDGFEGKHELIKVGDKYPVLDVPNVEEFISKRLIENGFKEESIIETENFTYSDIKIDGNTWNRTLTDEEITASIKLLEPIYKKQNRNKVVLYLSGWLAKGEVEYSSAEKLIRALAHNDEEKSSRLRTLKASYDGLEEKSLKAGGGIFDLFKKCYTSLNPEGREETQSERFDREERIMSLTKERYNRLRDILISPYSKEGIKSVVKKLKSGSEGLKLIKKLHKFFRERFNIVKDSKTGEIWIYNPERCIYEEHNDDRFLEFLSQNLGDEVLTMEGARKLKSIFSNREEESREYIAFKNGLLDLDTLKLHDFSHEHFIKYQVPYEWNLEATGGFVEEKVKEILIDQEGDRAGETYKYEQYLQMLGYCFVEGNPKQKLFLIIGPPGSGKTQLNNIIAGIFKEGVASVPLQSFKDRFGLQPLIGKKVNILSDISDKEINDPSVIKAITGTDSITIDRKNKEPITIEGGLPIKTIGAGNELPRIRDDSKAMARRLILLDCKNCFTDNPIYNLSEKILADDEGMGWLIHESIMAYKDLENNGNKFILEKDSKQAHIEYLEIADPTRAAAEALLIKSNDENDFYTSTELINLMDQYLKTRGLRIPKNNKDHHRAIKEIGGEYGQRRINNRVERGYILIRPKDGNNDPKKNRLDKHTRIQLNKEEMFIDDFSREEQSIFELLNGVHEYTVDGLISDAEINLNLKSPVVMSILRDWQKDKMLFVDNSHYLGS